MAQYSTGTVEIPSGTPNIVTGIDTEWLVNVQAGDEMLIGTDVVFYTIGSVDSNTQVTLTVDYPNPGFSGFDYVITSDFTTFHGIPKLNQGDLKSADTYTRAMTIIDQALSGPFFGGKVLDKDLNAAPGAPSDGDAYIVAVGVATGDDWFGEEDSIATWDSGTSSWVFLTPYNGLWVNVTDEKENYIYGLDGWERLSLTVFPQRRWEPIDTFNAQAPSSTTITMTSDLTSLIRPGTPVRYTLVSGITGFSAGTYYAVCTAITSGLLTIAGPLLPTDPGAVSALEYGLPEMVSHVDFFIEGLWAAGTETQLLQTQMNTGFYWKSGRAYVVEVSAIQGNVDSGSEPEINIRKEGSRILTAAMPLNSTNFALETNGTSEAIDPDFYDMDRNETIEIECQTAGGSGDAEDLTVMLTIVHE